MRIVSIGEILWDVMGDQEFLGGAPLNFSVSSRRLGNEVAFISAVGADQRGALAIQSIEALGLSPKFIRVIPEQETGTALVTTDKSGNATFVIKRPVAFDFLNIEDSRLSDLAVRDPDWIYFGTLAQTSARNEALLHRLVAGSPKSGRFYDVNLREGHWNPELVQRLSGLASIIKLNESEAETLFRFSCGSEQFSPEKFCGYWSRIYGAKVICITLGEHGCAIWSNDGLQNFKGYPVKTVDTVGAGDAFSAAFLQGAQLGWPMERTASFANALGAIVAGRAGAIPSWTVEECLGVMESSRSDTKNRTDALY